MADAAQIELLPVAVESDENRAEQSRAQLPTAPENGLVRSLERRRLRAYLALLSGDVAILLGCFYAVSAIYLGTLTDWSRLDSGMLSAYVILPLYLTIALYNGTYSRRALVDWQDTALKALVALALSAALLNLLAFFAKINAELSRVVFVAGLMSVIIPMIAMRVALVRAVRKRLGPTAINRLAIHAGGPAFDVPHAQHIDASEHGLVPDIDDPRALDRLSKYLRNMDEVIVSCSQADRPAWAKVLKGTGISGEVVHQLSRDIGAIDVVHHDAAGFSALKVSTGTLGLRARAAKRIFDIVISGSALLMLSPIMLLVALLIKLEDGGPVMFVQRRMGRGNQFFEILKFRSMRESDADGLRSAAKDDDRITRIGRMIRRTSVDELPQLINVLRGDMSMVGPRPHALGSKAGAKLFWQVDTKYWQRHTLRPGITGLAQVRGYRGATDTEADLSHRLVADLEYMRGWTLWRDVVILVSTLRVLMHDRAF
ncbi:exopolysaccharide biosynthesis polyprenyl glycosylphosphotransferase [Aurantiacibacter aquimixticola]|uniref:Exopolysaccharide biosynthesis polyprenyl glycosylphosphotransferase n=1 Tax=Aurantiacibacter aquimixticola TaxID=1958945 RepID=A0A419RUL1_9SPHN|nr:exopolysaccharide biosynthesis polyprenyl glycosylphosphotransferase [Aurantiacibacter aquimixticola]RJY09469.1 exopolysaccharide biosynthesis polyprenyl glycosylphosphotransferase [Aurantiacibacter aquimixticola]